MIKPIYTTLAHNKNVILIDFWHKGLCKGRVTLIPEKNKHMGIWDVKIFEPFRGKGLGQEMMLEVLELLEKDYSDYSLIFLCVNKWNEKAIHIYKKLGFEFAEDDSKEFPLTAMHYKGLK